MIIIQTTIGSEEDARELTNYLVNKQLIACGTFQDSIHLQMGRGNPRRI